MDRYVPGCTSYVRPVIDAHGSPPETSCPVPAPTLDSTLWGTLLERARAGCTARDKAARRGVVLAENLLYRILRHLNPRTAMCLSRLYSRTMEKDDETLRDWFVHVAKVRASRILMDAGTLHLPLSSRGGSTNAMLLGVAGACESFRLLQRVQQSRVYGDGARWRAFALMTCMAFGTVALMGYLASEASSRSERPPECRQTCADKKG
jgi:hypothetical protein